jgi:hypothetical protein
MQPNFHLALNQIKRDLGQAPAAASLWHLLLAQCPPPILLVWLLGVVTPPLSWLGDPLLERLPGGWDLTTGGVMR